MKNQLIIVAGGSGTRMNSETPKQFLCLGGLPVLMHTLTVFRKFDPTIKIILVLPKEHIAIWNNLCAQYRFKNVDKVLAGGSNRFSSVKNGLAEIEPDGVVGIHDGVRPFVSLATIENCYAAMQEYDAVIPVIDMYESLREGDKKTNKAVDRSQYNIVQTPQVFKASTILSAYANAKDENSFTDDASVVEKNNTSIHLTKGNRENIKITTPFDLLIGEAILNTL